MKGVNNGWAGAERIVAGAAGAWYCSALLVLLTLLF